MRFQQSYVFSGSRESQRNRVLCSAVGRSSALRAAAAALRGVFHAGPLTYQDSRRRRYPYHVQLHYRSAPVDGYPIPVPVQDSSIVPGRRQRSIKIKNILTRGLPHRGL